MRVSYNKKTGRLIEMQSADGDLEVLRQNALNCGELADEIAVVNMTDKEYAAFLKAMPKLPEEQVLAIESDCKMNRFQRELAIASFPPGSFWRSKAEAAEKAIQALGVRST